MDIHITASESGIEWDELKYTNRKKSNFTNDIVFEVDVCYRMSGRVNWKDLVNLMNVYWYEPTTVGYIQ